MTKPAELIPAQANRRKRFSGVFSVVCLLVSSLAIVVLITLLASIFAKGGNFLSFDFLSGKHLEENPADSGIDHRRISCLAIPYLAVGFVDQDDGVLDQHARQRQNAEDGHEL